MANTRRRDASPGVRFAVGGVAEIARDRLDAPTVALLAAFGVLAGRAILTPLLDSASNHVVSALTQGVVGVLAGVAVALGIRAASGVHRHYGIRVLAGLVVVSVLSIAVSIEGELSTDEWALLAVFAAAALLTMYQLTPLVAADLPKPVFVGAWLDMLVFFASGLAITTSIAASAGMVVSDATIAVIACLGATVAWAVTAASMLFVRGVRSWLGGPFMLLGGVILVAVAAAVWIASIDTLPVDVIWPTDLVFSAGTLMIARGWLTWSVEAHGRQSAWLIDAGRDLASTAAIMLAIVVAVLAGPGAAHGSPALAFTAQAALIAGVVIAGIRQVAIKEYERRARFSDAATTARLMSEISDRGRVARALEGVEPGVSVAETAGRICERLLTLPCAAFAILTQLPGDGDGVAIAATGINADGFVGVPLAKAHADHLRECAVKGLWIESARPWLDAWLPPAELDRPWRVIRTPLVWEDQLVGVLSIGGIETGDTHEVARTTATVREAAVVVAALVGPSLAAEAALRRKRDRIDRIVAEQAFFPVYQPIVELSSERVIGFEALTRFADGTRPDVQFHEADAAGRGIELEVATLRAAVRDAVALPADAYLSLNLSAELASSVEVLGAVLTRMPRSALLEITEHVPVEDYERMMATLYALDIKIRLAVDDAGAGYAGLQHILAIRPHVVKLDAALVRSVDADFARQAIVEAMVSFASKTGCQIVAEGIETETEVATLRSLGVDLGQGYFFGRPRPAAEWSGALGAGAPAGS